MKKCAVGIPHVIEYDPCNGWISKHYRWMDAECESLEKVLTEYGVEVVRPHEISIGEYLGAFNPNPRRYECYQLFPRDGVFIVGDNGFHIGCRPSIIGYDLKFISMPCDWTNIGGNPKDPLLDGGDLILLGESILAGHSKHRYSISNEDGRNWIGAQVPDRDVIPVKMPDDFFHLDMALSIVNNNIVICSGEMNISKIIPEGMEIISVHSHYANMGLINGLAIAPDVYLTPLDNGIGCPDVIDGLRERGVNVIPIEYKGHIHALGGIRCSTVPLIRE